jgi:hypothetical protein
VPVALDQHLVFMQLDAGACDQKAVYRIAGPGQPQAAAEHFQAKAFGGVDHAGLRCEEGHGGDGLGHGASPLVRL